MQKNRSLIFAFSLIILFSFYFIDFTDRDNVIKTSELIRKDKEYPVDAGMIYSSAIQGIGPEINITLSERYQNDTEIYMDSSIGSNTTLNVPAPMDTNFNSSMINLTIGNIQASNQTIDVQVWDAAPTVASVSNVFFYGAAFTAPISGNLSRVQLNHGIVTAGTFDLYIYSSVWDSLFQGPKPGIQEGVRYARAIYSTPGPSNDYNYYNNEFYLDNSKTENNTWYIVAAPQNGVYNWTYLNVGWDGSANDTYSYVYDTGEGTWTYYSDPGLESYDLVLTVDYTPVSHTPSPSQINLQINGSAVENWTIDGAKGRWLNTSIYNGGALGNLNFVFTSNWSNAIWWLKCVNITYEYQMAKNQSTYYIPSADSPVNWTIQYTVKESDSFKFESKNFTDFRINFTIPANWTPVNAYRESFATQLDALNITYSPLSGNWQTVEINPEDWYGNNTWILNCSNSNIGNGIEILKDSTTPVNIAYYQDSIQPKIYFKTAFTGDVYLEVFNVTTGTRTFESGKKSVTGVTDYSFTAQLASIFIGTGTYYYGNYTFQIWGNSSATPYALLNETIITIVANTSAILDVTSALNNSRWKSDAVFNIVIHYSDLRLIAGGDEVDINTADKVEVKNGSILYKDLGSGITNSGNGLYTIPVNAADFLNGTYILTININKTLFQNHSLTFNFSINIKPTVSGVALDASTVYTDTSVTVSYDTPVDYDNDPVFIHIEWYINGDCNYSWTNHSLIDGTAYKFGDSLQVQITPNDGLENGTMHSVSRIVQNTVPTTIAPTITAGAIYTDGSISMLTHSATDPDTADGQQLFYYYEWYINDEKISSLNNLTTVTGTWFKFGDKVELKVTSNDGTINGSELASTTYQTILNTIPTTIAPTITAGAIYTDGSISMLTHSATDPDTADGQQLFYYYEWYINDEKISSLNNLTTVTGTWFKFGDKVELKVTSNDGTINGSELASTTYQTILNTIPTTIAPTITAGAIYTDGSISMLTHSATDPDTADGQQLFYYYEWYINDEKISSLNNLTTVTGTWFKFGDKVELKVTSNDGTINGSELASTTYQTILNTIPTTIAPTITAGAIYTDGSISMLTHSATDPDTADGQQLFYYYEWYINDEKISSLNNLTTVTGTWFKFGDKVELKVTSNDGTINGSELASTTYQTILNTIPTTIAPTITAGAIYTDGSISMLTHSATDPDTADGQQLFYYYEWYINDEKISSLNNLTTVTGTWFKFGDKVELKVTSNDGTINGSELASTTYQTILNTIPTTIAPTITAGAIYTDGSISMLTHSATDPDTADGQQLFYYYEWYINDEKISSLNNLTTVTGTWFKFGDKVELKVTSNDGTINGSELASTTYQTILNTIPTTIAPTITAGAIYTDGSISMLTHSATDPDTADGQQLFYYYEWYINDEKISSLNNLTTVTGTWFKFGDKVELKVTSNDGTINGSELASTTYQTILNTIPTTIAPTITAGAIYTDGSISMLTHSATDPDTADGQQLFYYYEWYINDEKISSLNNLTTVTGTWFKFGDKVELKVTSNDGTINGSELASTTYQTILNTIPTTIAPTITAGAIYTDGSISMLTHSATDPDTADGQQLFYYYEWYINDEKISSLNNLTTVTGTWFKFGDKVELKVTSNDGTINGTELASTTYQTILNTIPTTIAPTITAGAIYTDGSISMLSHSATDPDTADGQQLFYYYEWYINDEKISSLNNLTTVTGTWFKFGDKVELKVTSNDGTINGSELASTTYQTILNTIPTTIAPTITAGAIYTDGSISMLTHSATDPDTADGQQLFYYYEWYINDEKISSLNNLTTVTGTWFKFGDKVELKVTSNDGTINGSELASTTYQTILNTIPTTIAPTITAGAIYTDGSISMLTHSATDPDTADGQQLFYYYEWYINDEKISSLNNLTTVTGTWFKFGDKVELKVTSNDGTINGSELASTTYQTILNTIPTTIAPTITAGAIYTDGSISMLTHSATDPDTADGQQLFYYYEWYINDEKISSLNNLTTVTGTWFKFGDKVELKVTSNDGTINGTTATSTTFQTILNTQPTANIPSITADPLYTNSSISTLEPTGSDLDSIEGQMLEFYIEWFINDIYNSSLTNQTTIYGTAFKRGDTVQVKVTAWDGIINSTTQMSQIRTILNKIPVFTAVILNATQILSNQSVSAIGQGFDDPDEADPQGFYYNWTINGVSVFYDFQISSVESVLNTTFNYLKGDIIAVQVWAFDGIANSTAWINSTEIKVTNLNPTFVWVELNATTIYANQSISAMGYDWDDQDIGDPASFYYNWSINGFSVWYDQKAEYIPSVLLWNLYNYQKGDNISVQVWAFDGTLNSTVSILNTTKVINYIPYFTGFSVETSYYANQSIIINPNGFVDIDVADSMNYTYNFSVNGMSVFLTNGTSAVLSSSYFQKGDTIQIEVWAFDGTDNSTYSIIHTTTIINYKPVIGAMLTTSTLYENETARLHLDGWYDAENNTDAHWLYISWSVNGQVISAAMNQSFLSEQFYTPGQVITIKITPFDGQENGTTVELTITVSYHNSMMNSFGESLYLKANNPTEISLTESQKVILYLNISVQYNVTLRMNHTNINPAALTINNSYDFVSLNWSKYSPISGYCIWYFNILNIPSDRQGNEIKIFAFDGAKWVELTVEYIDWAKQYVKFKFTTVSGPVAASDGEISQIDAIAFCVLPQFVPEIPTEYSFIDLIGLIIGSICVVMAIMGVLAYSRVKKRI